jgi:predicted protein tyrosine phosphatase
MANLSDEIRKCREGVVRNPFQGTDKKVLFVCSMGILRSATGARLYADEYNTRSAGTWDDALIPLTTTLLAWADEIVFVNQENYRGACKKFGDLSQFEGGLRVLNIPDNYPHMDPVLIKAFEEQYEPLR